MYLQFRHYTVYLCFNSKQMRILPIFLLLAVYFLLQSCSNVEGCNDPLAKNYNAEADKTCCCEYYQLRFDMAHSIDRLGTDFNLMEFYYDLSGDAYQVKSASILISSVSLIRADGSAVLVKDTVLLTLQDGSSVWTIDDYALLKPGTFVNDIGSFIDFGNYEKVRFLVGLQGIALNTDGTAITASSNPLASANGFYNLSNTEYRFGRWELIKNITDTTIYELKDTVWIELPYSVTAVDGVDTKIPIGLNYNKLFEGISFVNEDSTAIVQKIKNNTRNAFFIQ